MYTEEKQIKNKKSCYNCTENMLKIKIIDILKIKMLKIKNILKLWTTVIKQEVLQIAYVI